MRIVVTYQSNYNGVSIEDVEREDDLAEHPDREIAKAAEQCADEITNALYDDCDRDGYYQGSTKHAYAVMNKFVVKFLPQFTAEYKIDETSS